MIVHFQERLELDGSGERVVSPTGAVALVLVHVVSGEVGFTACRRDEERVRFPGSRDGWQLTGNFLWTPVWESGVVAGGRSVHGLVDVGRWGTVRLVWDGAADVVLTVVSI